MTNNHITETIKNSELEEMIDWCRKKIESEKHSYDGCTGKRMEGYEKAMKAVMSYLHSKKI